MEQGWIKLHNKFREWEWYQDSQMVHLMIHFLLCANYKETNWKGLKIEVGQLVVGRRQLSKDLGISEQSLRTLMTRLKSTHEITIKSTNQFSIITLINWDKYQGVKGLSTHRPTHKSTFNQPTINQQSTTPKEYIEYKEDKKNIYTPIFEEFWNRYPKKTGKGEVWKIWCRLKPSKELAESILQSVVDHKLTRQWKQNNGQYVPNPSTFLNQRRWEDEVEKEVSKSEIINLK